MYHMNFWTTRCTTPILENWFIAARPNAPFLQDWETELRRADTFSTVKDYLSAIQQTPYSVDLQNLGANEYLFMHAAAQVVLQSHSTLSYTVVAGQTRAVCVSGQNELELQKSRAMSNGTVHLQSVATVYQATSVRTRQSDPSQHIRPAHGV
jgi:hypothetical protein